MTLVLKNGRPSRVTPSFSSYCQGGCAPTWRVCCCVFLFLVAPCSMSDDEFINPWIPSRFLANYTFNSLIMGECVADDPSLGDAASSAPAAACGSERARSGKCLYLRGEAAAECVCSCPAGRVRAQVLRPMRLAFCTHHAMDTVLNLSQVSNESPEVCLSILRHVQRYDELAKWITCEFEHILSRYDCHNDYSSKWDCADCKAAYKNWVCAMLIPYHKDGSSYVPCRDFCFLVEQQCPYFLPDTKLQYAGESTFICTDPDIPEDFESLTAPTPYADLPHCYLPCHLGLGHRIVMDDDERCHRLVPTSISSINTSATNTSNNSITSQSMADNGNSNSNDATSTPLVNCDSRTVVTICLLLGVIGKTLLVLPFCVGLT